MKKSSLKREDLGGCSAMRETPDRADLHSVLFPFAFAELTWTNKPACRLPADRVISYNFYYF